MKNIIGSAIVGGGIAAALIGAGIGHADEYRLTPAYMYCTVSGTVKSDTISDQSCIDAFLNEAHKDNLISYPTDGRPSDSQLVSDGVIACLHGPASPAGSADINVTAAAVRRIDSTLSGGKPVFGGNEDVPAVDLVWVPVGTLCAGGIS